MAHLPSTTNGKVSYASIFGNAAWARAGNFTEGAMTAAESMEKGHLGYTVDKAPLFVANPDGSYAEVGDYFMTRRADTGERLGIVSKSYQVFQNAEKFDFMDALAKDGLRYVCVGAVGRGERVFLLATLPGEVRIKGTDDVSTKFVFLSGGHDGSTAVKGGLTLNRMLCTNQLTGTIAGLENAFTFSHRGVLADKAAEAARVLGLADSYFEAFNARANDLASRQITKEELATYLKAVYPDPEPKKGIVDDLVVKKVSTARMTITGLFEAGMGTEVKAIRGTAWAAYNAVTEFVDHHTQLQYVPALRAESVLFGDAAKIKAKAWDLATPLAGGTIEAPVVKKQPKKAFAAIPVAAAGEV